MKLAAVRNKRQIPERVTAADVVQDLQRSTGYFEENSFLRLGDADSAHGVLFGNFHDKELVAVKPFRKQARAEREADNLHRIQRLGFTALEPKQVIVGDLRTYLITDYRKDIRHMGQMSWNASIASPNLKDIITPAVEQASRTLAAWHSAQLYNGDAQVKNLAFDRQGESVYIDAERAQFNPPAGEDMIMGSKDLEMFGLTALARGLLADRSASFRAGYLNEHLLDPYFDVVRLNPTITEPAGRAKAITNHWVGAIDHGHAPIWALPQLETTQSVSVVQRM